MQYQKKVKISEDIKNKVKQIADIARDLECQSPWYLTLRKARIDYTIEIEDGLSIDLDKDKKVIGIEYYSE